MKTINIGNFKLGIDMLSEETNLPKGTARDIINIDLTTAGGFRRRPGITKLASFVGAHSMWAPRSQSFALYAHADALRMITSTIGARTLLSGLTPSDAMAYCEDGTDVYFTNGTEVGVVEANGNARLLGVRTPDNAPEVFARPEGGLLAGRYGAAYSYMGPDGESGLSAASFIDLPSTGGISFVLPEPPDGVVVVRLYLTAVNGDVLYQMAEIPAGLFNYVVADDTPGKAALTQFMHRMPGGDIVRVYKGRLLVARGDTVVFSEPFNYGLTSRRHNFVQFQDKVTMIEPVETGVFVGTAKCVYFLNGSRPGDFGQTLVSMNAPVMGASTLLDSATLPDEMERLSDAPVALWLGRIGYSVGMNTGLVHDVQSDRIDLPSYEAGTVVTCTKNGLTQVISVVQSEQSTGAGSAIDAPI